MERELLTITKKSSAAFIGRFFGVIFSFTFNLLAARYMGAAIYGQVMYTMTILLFISSVTRMGMKDGLIYLMPIFKLEDRIEERNGMISFSIFFSTMLSIIFIILLCLARDWLAIKFANPWLAKMILLMAPLLPFLSILELSQGVFRGIEIVKYHVLGENIFLPILKVILVTVFAITGYYLYGLVATLYISYILVISFLLFYLIKHSLFGKIKKSDIRNYSRLLSYSFPLLLSGMLSFFIGRLDIFMIGIFLMPNDIGIYNIALRIGTLSSVVLISFNTIFAPVISSLYHRKDLETMAILYKTITKWIVAINLSVFSMILLFSGDIMRFFGEEFKVGALALILISVGEAVNAGVGPAETIIIMTAYSKYELFITCISLLLNGVINYFLIPVYGIEGAAFATLFTLAFMNITRLLIVYKKFKFLPYNRDYIKVISSAIISISIVYFVSKNINLHYVLNIVTSTILYFTCFISLIFLQGISKEDRLILDRVKEYLSRR